MEKCLEHLSYYENSKFVVGGSRKHIENNVFYSPSKIYCFDTTENIGIYQISLFMKSDSVLQVKINDIIQKLLEGGLFVKWNRDNLRRRQHEIPFIATLQMTFEHVSMNFYCVMTFGIGLAILTFTFELIAFRKTRKCRERNIWFYLDQYFTPNRNCFGIHFSTNQ